MSFRQETLVNSYTILHDTAWNPGQHGQFNNVW